MPGHVCIQKNYQHIFIIFLWNIAHIYVPRSPATPHAADTIRPAIRVYLAATWEVATNGALFFFNQLVMLPG